MPVFSTVGALVDHDEKKREGTSQNKSEQKLVSERQEGPESQKAMATRRRSMYPTTAAASAPVPKPTMASRRRSVMPPPAAAAAPKIAKAPVAKVKLVCGI